MTGPLLGRSVGEDRALERSERNWPRQFRPRFVATFDLGSPHAVAVTGLDADPNPHEAIVYINNPCTGLQPFTAVAETPSYADFSRNLKILVQKTGREQRGAFSAHPKAT